MSIHNVKPRALSRLALILAALMICLSPLLGQELAEDELFSVERGSVEFFNYEGPHERIESDEEIRAIGSSLAGADGSYAGKYRRFRILPGADGKLGAEVFEILPAARVDHVDNIRRILSGYLQSSYELSREEADTIALFASFYNAVYRAKRDYVESVYSAELVQVLDFEKMGLATDYRQWPGKSQLLVPLTLGGDQEGRIAADDLGDEDVVREIRDQEEDKGVDDRKGMVEIREEQLEEDKQVLEEERESLEEDKQELKERGEVIDRAEEEGAEMAPDQDKSPEQTIEEAKEELAAEEEQLEERESALQEKEEQLEERQEAISQERDEIARDEQQQISEEEERRQQGRRESTGDGAPGETVSFLRVRESDGILLSSLVYLIPDSGELVKQSTINTIRGRRVYSVGDFLAAVVGIDDPPKQVKLILLDKEELETVAEGDRELYGEGLPVIRDGKIFAPAKIQGQWKLAAFDGETANFLYASQQAVSPAGLILDNGDYLLLESASGELLRLDPADLSSVEQ